MITTKRLANAQQTLDIIIDKVFLRFIPHSVKPNQVTVVRFILVPVVYWLLVSKRIELALVVFVIAACTDFIDGAMARTRDQITDVGKVIDPIADKLLILVVIFYIGLKYLIVKIMTLFVVVELVTVLIGVFLASSIGKPVGANVFGKIKMIFQGLGVAVFLLGMIISNNTLVIISEYLLMVAIILAVLSGIESVRRKLLQNKDVRVVF